MAPRTPIPTTWPLAACLCVLCALMAVPERGRGREHNSAPLEQLQADAARASEARFEARSAPKPAAPRDTSALWRRWMLDQALTARAARFGARFYDFPSISDARACTDSAPGAPFPDQPVEASASSVRIVGRGNVSGVWEGVAVPLEALDAPSRWLTPSVGRVRAELVDGTAFEGRLHSLGEGKLWIENDLGRIALLGTQVRTLRQLPPLAGGANSGELPALPLVHVRTPGGVFQGRLLRREEGRVTLLTAEGGQVTLDDAELETVRPGPDVRHP